LVEAARLYDPSVVVIEALPLTPNGKVDRRALLLDWIGLNWQGCQRLAL